MTARSIQASSSRIFPGHAHRIKHIRSFSWNRFNLLVYLSRILLNEIAHQGWNVVLLFAQGRHDEWKRRRW